MEQTIRGKIDSDFLDRLAKEIGVEITMHGNDITVEGDEAEVDEALAKINEHLERLEEFDFSDQEGELLEEGEKISTRKGNELKSYDKFEIVDFDCPAGYANCIVTSYVFDRRTFTFKKKSVDEVCVEQDYLKYLKEKYK